MRVGTIQLQVWTTADEQKAVEDAKAQDMERQKKDRDLVRRFSCFSFALGFFRVQFVDTVFRHHVKRDRIYQVAW